MILEVKDKPSHHMNCEWEVGIQDYREEKVEDTNILFLVREDTNIFTSLSLFSDRKEPYDA